MSIRRSPIALLCALIALLGVPAMASAQTPGCSGTDPVPSGGPDVTAPQNDTPPANPGWYTTPYTVTLAGSDSESGLATMQYCIDNGPISDAGSPPDVTIASSGVWTLNTRAVDNEGNVSAWRAETVRVDVTTPVDITDPGGPGWHNTPTSVVVLAADSDSGVKQVWWQLDGGLAQSGANGTSVPIVADGTHTLKTWAEDFAGNTSVPRDHTVRVDTVTPSDTTAAPGGWQTAPLPVTVTGADGHSGIAQVTYQLDGGSPVTAPAPTVVTVSGDGDHVLATKVRDNAGNESGWKTTNIRIDTTAPDNQTPTDDGSWRAADYAVMVRGADSGSGLNDVQWRVDAGAITSGASPLQAVVTGTADHLFETRVRDVAGNASAWRVEHIRIDRTTPTNTTTPAPSSPVGNGYQVTVSGTDSPAGVDHVEWKLDGGAAQSGASGASVTITGNGTHTLETRVVDRAGNASAWRTDQIELDAVTGDATPPTDTTTTAPVEWRTGAIAVTVAATDAESGVADLQWRLDGSPLKSTLDGENPSFTISGDGEHLLETRASDNAGRTSGWREQTFKIDGSLPEDGTAIPSGWTDSRTVTLTGADEFSGIAEIEYRVGNSGPFLHGTVGQVVDVGGDGTFTIWHRAIDLAGNATTRLGQQLKVDTVDPANTSAVPPSTWQPTALSLDLTGTDTLSGVESMQWRLNAGAIQNGGPAVVDEDGDYTLETRAVDAAGNDSGWRSDTVRVDVTAPANDTPAAPTGWRSTPYTVHVDGSDGAGSGVAGVEVKIDGGAVSADPDVTVTGDGVHTLETRVVDNVGHASEWRNETIRIDSAVPTAALACPVGWNPRAVSCTATANGGASGIGSLSAARDGGAFAAVSGGAVPVTTDGDHTITLKAIDGAGNVTSTTAHVKVDRARPIAALSCAPAAAPTGYACRASGSDATSGLAALSYSLGGGAWTPVPAGGALSVLKGTVRVRAIDRAGNQTLSGLVTLADRVVPEETPTATTRVKTVPVYLGHKTDPDSMIGALKAARSANGTVSIDLRPLAVGRGTFRVEIRLKSGARKRTVTKTYTVGRGGTLRRMNASLSGATAKTTVTLTVTEKRGGAWKRYAGGRLVLAK